MKLHHYTPELQKAAVVALEFQGWILASSARACYKMVHKATKAVVWIDDTGSLIPSSSPVAEMLEGEL